jgi:hypothetical protein
MTNLKETNYAIKCHRCMDRPAKAKILCSTCQGKGILPVYSIDKDAKPEKPPKKGILSSIIGNRTGK